jgi:hypothetical protein
MLEIDKYFCTCGADFETEQQAVRHVTKRHATEEQIADQDKLRTRVVVWIYSNSPFSWQKELYGW